MVTSFRPWSPCVVCWVVHRRTSPRLYDLGASWPVRPWCLMTCATVGCTGCGILFVDPAWPQRRSYCDKARLSESGNGGDGGRAPYITKAKVARLVSPACSSVSLPIWHACLARVTYSCSCHELYFPLANISGTELFQTLALSPFVRSSLGTLSSIYSKV